MDRPAGVDPPEPVSAMRDHLVPLFLLVRERCNRTHVVTDARGSPFDYVADAVVGENLWNFTQHRCSIRNRPRDLPVVYE